MSAEPNTKKPTVKRAALLWSEFLYQEYERHKAAKDLLSGKKSGRVSKPTNHDTTNHPPEQKQ
jgi:hypothetical protein